MLGQLPSHRDARLAALLGAGLTLYTLLFYRDVLFDGRVVVYRDQYTILLAIDWIVRLLSQWNWPPLWTPFQVLGKPLAADPLAGIYYPVNWAARLLPFPLGYNASLALHHVLAAAGLYALLRQRDIGPAGAACGGLFYGFGGWLVSCDNMINALQSATWAPWTALAFDRWCLRGGAFALVATGTGVALTLLGGMPEVFLFEQVLFAAIALDHRGRGGPGLARAAGAAMIANLLGIGLGAVQLLPMAEYLLHSSRSGGLEAGAAVRLSLPPLGALAFLLPRHYVGPDGAFHDTAALWEASLADAPWALALYLGPLLAMGAGARLEGRRSWLWIGVGLVFLALACGAHTPGYRWLIERVPVLRAARHPEKFLLVVHGLLAVLAACGLDAAVRTPRRFRRIAATALALAVSCAGAALALNARPDFALSVLRRDLWIAGGLLLAVAILARRGAAYPRAVACALVLLAAADLYRVNAQLLPTVPFAALRTRPASVGAMVRGDDPLRIYSDGVGRPPVRPFPEVFLQEQNLLFWEVANYYGIANLNAPSSLNLTDHERLAELIEAVPPERVAALLAAFNTAYVTSPKDLGRYRGLQAVLVPSSPLEAYVYRVDGLVPRAYVPHTIAPVVRAEDAIDYLRGADEPARRVAVAAADVPLGTPPRMRGSATLAAYRSQEVEVTATMETDGLVVLSDTFYPGWEATVDGAAAPIVRANYFARGVFVPAGAHRVVFRYRPASHRLGALVSTATALLALVLLATAGGWRRRQRRPVAAHP